MEQPSREVTVRAKIATGILATGPCAEVWGGTATGVSCAACDTVINAPAFEYECRSDDGDTFWLCQPCLFVWDAVIRDSDRGGLRRRRQA